MPNRLVELHRWQVVGAFLLLLATAILVALWNDYQIDEAERRITQNQEVNVAQDRTRKLLLQTLREADERACLRIEVLKTLNRQEALRNFSQLERNARLLEIEVSPELRRVARSELARDLKRNRASEC